MANDANIFKIASTGAVNVRPEIYESEILDILTEMNPFRSSDMTGIVDVLNYQGVAGNLINIPSAIKLGAAAAVTDGDSVPVIKPTFGTVQLTSGITGLHVQMTQKQIRDQFSTARENIVSQMAYNLAELETTSIMTTLQGTSSAVIYASTATTDDTVTAGMTFDVALINKGLVALRAANSGKGKKVLLVTPKQEGDLRLLQQFTDASYLGDSRVNMTGFIGTFFGVNVLSSNFVNTVDNSSSLAVQYGMLLGEDSLYIVDKMRPVFEIDRGLIADLSFSFLITADTGYSIKRNESVRLLKSA